VSRYALGDRVLIGWTLFWTVAVLAIFGITSAIIPNPVFGRAIAPGPAAVAVWLASGPLMGFVMATYVAPPPMVAVPLGQSGAAVPVEPREATTLGTIGGFAAFLAIGCPTCNKIALILLGTSGAANIFGPIQPVIGVASLVLLAVTVAWRLRLRARGGACEVPAAG